MENNKTWFIANDKGDVLGHDLDEYTAKTIAQEKQEQEPNEGWEALNSEKEL
jgi:prophage antirepressor-like protein